MNAAEENGQEIVAAHWWSARPHIWRGDDVDAAAHLDAVPRGFVGFGRRGEMERGRPLQTRAVDERGVHRFEPRATVRPGLAGQGPERSKHDRSTTGDREPRRDGTEGIE